LSHWSSLLLLASLTLLLLLATIFLLAVELLLVPNTCSAESVSLPCCWF